MRLRRLPLIFFLLCTCAAPASALTFVWTQPIYWLWFVYIEVGAGAPVATVSFSVPAGQAGNGVAVVGTPGVLVRVIGRRTLFGNSNYLVTVDSSTGLQSAGGATLPFSKFSWTAATGTFAPGTFNGTANQQFFRYTGSYLGFEDTLTFRYVNDSVHPSGTYTGQVRFTIAQI